MGQKTTLKDLSKILNLSVSTVSKSLNDSNEISQATKIRVKELAKLNSYIPNSFAKNLKSTVQRTVGIIIPSIELYFFSQVVKGIERKASEIGYKIIVCISNETLEKEIDSLKSLIERQVDGLIVAPSRETYNNNNFKHLRDIQGYKLPLVLLDRIPEKLKCDKIFTNEGLLAELAINDLLKSGCRNIAYITEASSAGLYRNKQIGYFLDLNRRTKDFPITELILKNLNPGRIIRLLKSKNIDGILASDELTAIRLMRILLSGGVKVPDEVSVIGFTNGPLSEYFLPSLSIIDQNATEQGRLSLELIFDRINGAYSQEPVHYTVEASIIHRDSTRNSNKRLRKS